MTAPPQNVSTSATPPRAVSPANAVLLVSPNAPLREQLARMLRGLRWLVQEAGSGAEAWLRQEETPSGAVLLDDWLPDLSSQEFAQQFLQQFATVDMLSMHGVPFNQAVRSTRRNELLLALREVEDSSHGGAAPAPSAPPPTPSASSAITVQPTPPAEPAGTDVVYSLSGIDGTSPPMRELAKLVHLAAPHNVTVLIEGETGTGKELIARAVHRLSTRAAKPFMTLNCAAIPEQLLEAELFGHTRGAFTGAVTSRTGRIEAAHGGTLFLDEIGEMPVALQAKMLRFLECGEIQRIGDNETFKVDVRIVAATHQPLEQRSEEGLFRLDLYHRLAMFPVAVPPLRERMEDLPILVNQTLHRLGQHMPRRGISEESMALLRSHNWPGNVRELLHVLQRAIILSRDQAEIQPQHIRLRRRPSES